MTEFFREQLPLLIVIVTTALSIGISLISLSSNVYIIFQSFFYIPIILACIFFLRRGLLFSTILAAIYLFILNSCAGPEHLPDGLIQVLLFIAIAFVITLLAERSKEVEESLKLMNEELTTSNDKLIIMNDRLAGAEEKMQLQLEELTQIQHSLRDEIERKSDFVTIASHELRTPLQPALGYLSMLTSDPEGFEITPEVHTMLTRCLKNIDQERITINRMLELSLVDSGKIQPTYEKIPLYEFIEGIIRASISSSEARVSIEIPRHVVISGDQHILYQVFVGLISNAIQFSEPPREVIVEYDRDAGYHIIRVVDNGIGIDASAQKKIFEPFYIADFQSLSRDYNRLGLGLPIAQRYIQIHGGEITVKSEVGKGSTFTVRLPNDNESTTHE